MGATSTLLWPSPRPLWQASSAAVAAGQAAELAERQPLSGPWRLLLLGDGSPTRHLQSLTGLPVEVEVIAMAPDPNPGEEAPAEVAELDLPLLRRQVWLRCGSHTLAWAESWWNQAQAEQHLRQRNQPIWRSLTAERAELYREVDGLARVEAPWLERGFGQGGPYWSRHYRFFRGGREFTVIREVFSPQLEHWLGPASPEGFSGGASSGATPGRIPPQGAGGPGSGSDWEPPHGASG
jgi:chorismate--pyruvate lyase